MLNIKLRVRNLTRREGTANPFLLAKSLNITIIQTDLPDDIRGFLVRVLKRKCIIVNIGLSELAAYIVVCHEIGHAMLHTGYGYHFHFNHTYYVPSSREREANEFAARLLSCTHDIDSDLIASVINEKRPDPKIVHRMLTEITSNYC